MPGAILNAVSYETFLPYLAGLAILLHQSHKRNKTRARMLKHFSNHRSLIYIALSTSFAQIRSRYPLSHVVAIAAHDSRPAVCLYNRLCQVAPIVRRHIIVVGNYLNHMVGSIELLCSEAANILDLEPSLSDHVFDTFQVLIGERLLV